MAEARGIALHPEAAEDIIEIWEYIAEDNPAAAERVLEEIAAAIHSLTLFPKQGHFRPDLTLRPLRFWRVRDYLIAYAPDKKPLRILALIHGRRNPSVIAAILKGRDQ